MRCAHSLTLSICKAKYPHSNGVDFNMAANAVDVTCVTSSQRVQLVRKTIGGAVLGMYCFEEFFVGGPAANFDG